MQSSKWRALGTGEVLGFLRADLKRAKSGAWIVGPWIDGFFADFVLSILPKTAALHIVTRPPSGATPDFVAHAVAARACFDTRPNTLVKLLPKLHAKVIVIDDEIGYCGSANWYRYSLVESREIVLRGPVAGTQGLLDEVQVIWDQATSGPATNEPIKTAAVARGYTSEVSDPVAAAKLKQVPGSFIVGRSRRRR